MLTRATFLSPVSSYAAESTKVGIFSYFTCY
jgi:hypothetical protein